MKRAWFPILLCLVFIVAYEALVVRPYYSRQAKQNPPATEGPAKEGSEKLESAAPVANNVAAIPAPPSNSGWVDVRQMSLPNAVGVKLGLSGRIGDAEFLNYLEREQVSKQPVRTLKSGAAWSSNNPSVSRCLSLMKWSAEDGGGELVQSASTEDGECRVGFTQNSQNPQVLSVSLFLKGFLGAEGQIFFSAQDGLGEGPTQDHNYASYKIDGSHKSARDGSLKELVRKQGKVDWFVWGDRYFSFAILPRGKLNPNVFYSAAEGKDKEILFGFDYPLLPIVAQGARFELDVFFGMRDSKVLSAVQADLEEAVDYGFFGFVAKALHWLLLKINLVFGNFGVSIVVLTLLVRIVFWPLNKKVYVSGLKMKQLAPEMEKLKAKYGSDKSKAADMNRELLGLYKKHSVNPLGSCFPLLLQMPIFIGLYGALNHAIDLYQAPFFGWIMDLSSKDPYYVFPILWTLSLLAYLKINPQAMQSNPNMPDMTWVFVAMNIFFGFLSKDWPAGLTLYLFVSNLVGISQQLVMQRAIKLEPLREGA
jgi:YidC/Oxa1 family membrane protein insertase